MDGQCSPGGSGSCGGVSSLTCGWAPLAVGRGILFAVLMWLTLGHYVFLGGYVRGFFRSWGRVGAFVGFGCFWYLELLWWAHFFCGHLCGRGLCAAWGVSRMRAWGAVYPAGGWVWGPGVLGGVNFFIFTSSVLVIEIVDCSMETFIFNVYK